MQVLVGWEATPESGHGPEAAQRFHPGGRRLIHPVKLDAIYIQAWPPAPSRPLSAPKESGQRMFGANAS